MGMKMLIVAVAIGALVVAACLLFGRGADTKRAASATTVSGDATTSAGSVRAPRDRRPNPRTLARASFGGTVTERVAGPLAGAQVCARGWVEDVPTEETRDPRCVTTDAQGHYVIDKLYVGTYSVSASAPHKVPARWRGPLPDRDGDFRLKAGEVRTGVDLVVAPGAVEVRGTVQDINGGPIADAWVEVGNGMQWSREAGATTRSDVDGTFSVWVGPGAIHASANADGYASGSADGRAPTALLEILLTPESALAGTVVEADTGKPVPDATIWIEDGDGGRTVSDADGRWRIDRLAPGRYKPSARSLGKFGEPAASVRLGLGQVVDGIVIPVHDVQVVTGRVVIDDGTGDLRGCPKAGVWAQTKTGRYISGQADDDDPDGEIRIEAVSPGSYELQAWCDGYIAEPEYPDLVIANDDITGLEWRVRAGGSIIGTVKTRAGTPIAGARISAQTVGGDPRGARSWSSATTEDDGSYRLTGLAAGEVAVETAHDAHPKTNEPTRATVTAGQETRLDIVVDDGGTIAGIVVDEDGAPVRGAQVHAWGTSWSLQWDSIPTSGDDGAFEVTGLEPGSYRVQASRGWSDIMRKPGSTEYDVRGERVDVALGQTAQVQLVVEARRGVIAGIVIDATGAPVPDAYLAVEHESDIDGAPQGAAARSSRRVWDRKPVVTDPNGAFVLEELSPGTYTVRAYRRGGGEAIAEHVAPGTRDARLVIKSTGSVSGTVTLGGGGEPDDVKVSISDKQTGFRRGEQFFRTGGAFTLAELPHGTFKLTATATDGRGELELELAEGEQKSGVNIELAPRATVKGRLVDLVSGEPVPGMQVLVQPPGSPLVINHGGGTEHITDTDGRFVIEDVPTGRVDVAAVPIDWDTSPYNVVRVPRTLAADGGVIDLGELEVVRRRAGPSELGGDFGMDFKEYGPEIPEDEQKLEVRRLRPGGSAEVAGVKVGDVIVTIDDHDVTGDNRYLAWPLMHVSVGASVSFGFANGATRALVAAAQE